MEGVGKVDNESDTSEDVQSGEVWWAKGVTLSLWLRADVMARLRSDRGLTAFACDEIF